MLRTLILWFEGQRLFCQRGNGMFFKENLKAKIKADRLFRKLVSTMKEPPPSWWVDVALVQEFIEMTDFEHKKFRDLHLYVRPLEGEGMEVLVLDNELAIYHTTVADVALRKSPRWQEMISIRNIKKIMNHHDVLVSTGKASLRRLHANALALLDLTVTRDDLMLLMKDARNGLERESIEQVQESLDLFVDLLDFKPLPLDILERDLQLFARPVHKEGTFPGFEHRILFDEKTLSVGLKKGAYSPEDDLDLAWVMEYASGEESADLEGMDVFKFLAELAIEKTEVA
jgi:hypothetical protein